jgi:cytochrome P450
MARLELPFAEEQIIATDYYGRHSHPHDLFAWLRANDPLRWFEPKGFLPFWAATKHADILEIERQPEIFSSEPRTEILPTTLIEAAQSRSQEVGTGERMFRSLVDMDPPDHTRYRELVQPWFTPTNLKRLEARVEEITREVIDDMMGDGSVRELDFVQEVAVWHPLRMICELLGVPRSDEGLILKLTNEIFAGEDPEMNRAGDSSSLMTTIMDLVQYFTKVTQDRRENPAEDLSSYIANGTIDGEYLPAPDLFGYYIIVATAGHETTRTAMSGGLLALLTHADEMAKLRADTPGRVKLAVEEMIRWSTPVAQFCRVAKEDYVLRGQTIREGDSVGLFYASANRDEEVFEDPQSFKVDRMPNRHLAFGSGPHQCLGNLLARMELRIMYTQLLPRVESIELAGDPEFLQASFVHGVKHLPIRFKLAPAS